MGPRSNNKDCLTIQHSRELFNIQYGCGQIRATPLCVKQGGASQAKSQHQAVRGPGKQVPLTTPKVPAPGSLWAWEAGAPHNTEGLASAQALPTLSTHRREDMCALLLSGVEVKTPRMKP